MFLSAILNIRGNKKCEGKLDGSQFSVHSFGGAPLSCPHVQVVMEIFFDTSIFVFLPAGGVGNCSITVNAVSEKKLGGILDAKRYCVLLRFHQSAWLWAQSVCRNSSELKQMFISGSSLNRWDHVVWVPVVLSESGTPTGLFWCQLFELLDPTRPPGLMWYLETGPVCAYVLWLKLQ